MAFDFNGNNRSAATPNSTTRRDIDYASVNADSGFPIKTLAVLAGDVIRRAGLEGSPLEAKYLPGKQPEDKQDFRTDRQAILTDRSKTTVGTIHLPD